MERESERDGEQDAGREGWAEGGNEELGGGLTGPQMACQGLY